MPNDAGACLSDEGSSDAIHTADRTVTERFNVTDYAGLEPTSRDVVTAGATFMRRINAGQIVRIVDLHGNQAVDTFFFNALDPHEHYSAVNTIRAQQRIYLTTGTALISSEDRTLLTIIADTCGRHDTLGGACAAQSNTVRYDHGKKFMHNCRDSFLLAMANWHTPGSEPIGKRHLGANINFFMNVPVLADGRLEFVDGLSQAGMYVDLRAAMDVIMLVSNCPQLNNPCNAYNPTPIEIQIWE